MATETNPLPEVTVIDAQTGQITTRPMTPAEYADYLETLEYIANHPTV